MRSLLNYINNNLYLSTIVLIIGLIIPILTLLLLVTNTIYKGISEVNLIPNFRIELGFEEPQVVSTVLDTIVSYNDQSLKDSVLSYLGDRSEYYGVYVYDLKAKREVLAHQELNIFPSASISKLPSVILTLKDIDEGKYGLEDTITIKGNLKHTDYDRIAVYPNGSEVPVSIFIEEAILTSNNSAHYHLHDNLGGAGVVNPRTQQELSAEQFFLDPLWARPADVGRVLIDVYEGNTLGSESKELLLGLMSNTVASLRVAIPAGIPSDVEVANKVGFLFGGKEGNTFADAAIVFGENTEYVLVVLNNKTTPFPTGSAPIKDISTIVYNFMQESGYTIK